MEEIFKEVSKQLNLPIEVVRKTYTTYWKYLRENIEKIPIEEDLTEDDFNKYQTKFNLPNLGTLFFDYNNIISRNKYGKHKKDKT